MTKIRNEYGLPPLSGVVSATKVRNAIIKIDPTLQVSLRNVRINGQLQGCTGFVTNPANGKVAYLSTDRNHGTNSHAMYRTAKHNKDFSGGTNRFCGVADLPIKVIRLVSSDW